ncbi:OmpA family protein [Vogesella fluminis]|uniref:OmpA-like domain-containing protein n=1 Tax=Vogesella fluminis TaxID=1069161 RepID=A0ABQ3H8C8_9NEIS|nr:OmpA family protein [Vogesella fluminis]GHD72794.1 hypothetical protein GCM10011419_06590 [Vogesella fluminis]
MQLKSVFRTSALSLVITSLLAGCASPQGGRSKNGIANPFVSDDPCANTSRNIGIAVGTIGGALLGHYAGNNKKNSALIGSVLGGAVGGLIGYSMDKKRCELAKLAQRHQLELTVSTINNNGELVEADKSSKIEDSILGVTISITDKENHGGHFQPGSDKLTSRAEQYFVELARIYNPERVGEEEIDTSKRADLKKLALQRKLLLIGHTDDTGSSAFNAVLSERRARAVARFLSRYGIPEYMLYYQGAGEIFPVADNRVDSGRAQNRRVELVELGDENRFRTYLETRTPRYEFYRNENPERNNSKQPDNSQATVKPSDNKKAGNETLANTGKILGTNDQAKTDGKAAGKNKPVAVVVGREVENTPAIPPTGKAGKVAIGKVTQPVTIVTLPASNSENVSQTSGKTGLDFGGNPVSGKSVELDFGRMTVTNTGGFISKAWADDVPLAGNCAGDRPRVSGQVKVLITGKTYATSDYMPGLYNTSWVEKVNGHLVALNKLAVLRQDAQIARLPELLVYPNYQNNANAKAAVRLTPRVNTYRGSKGLLYRVFVNHGSGLQCIDLVLPYSPPFAARGGYVYQKKPDGLYRASYVPKIVGS